MKIRTEAHLFDTLTGERGVEVREEWGHDDDVVYEDHNIWYWWNEGNGSCDCNRALSLYRSLGMPDIDVECGDDRFILERLTADGRELK